ncbi:DUF2487 family protein [Paenibacillus protaetiae]|uniref:DUF2487 family protein n=1 Tax=Paenibacillus protaetiae TaxID=2509456 RepID=A0A4P6EUI9_9BACL|nr:DUF2487 family protein [Paenibacillus protaetiae]QAY66145.1 DUF2487 family protein [Paenibacillus protaetiae]
MKFSEIEESKWNELEPYLDTCLLPVTGMTGLERPYEATQELERLRDIMDLVEVPFKGRIVTYPACHYGGEEITNLVNKLCGSLKTAGFKFVIVITAKPLSRPVPEHADLVIAAADNGKLPDAAEVSQAIRELWNSGMDQEAI